MDKKPMPLPTHTIALEFLENWNPLNHIVWPELDTPVSTAEIQTALTQNQLEQNPVPATAPREKHIARIAHFVANPTPEPIEIDVGVPALCLHIDWIIIDGNHRLAAAFFSHTKTIAAMISGDINHANQLLQPKPRIRKRISKPGVTTRTKTTKRRLK